MKALLVLFLLAGASAFGADAAAAFAAKDYPAAIRQAEEPLSSAPSAEGFYDVGLAHEKSGQPVEAALNYQRALLLDPGLGAARNALAKLAASKSIPLRPPAWTNDVAAFLHPDTLVLLGALLLWGGAFGLVFATQARSRRTGLNALAGLALIFGAAALAAGWLADARMTSRALALVVAKDGAEVLTSPAHNSTPILSLPAGTTVDVLSPRGPWSYVDLNGAQRGWVQTERLRPVVPGATL